MRSRLTVWSNHQLHLTRQQLFLQSTHLGNQDSRRWRSTNVRQDLGIVQMTLGLKHITLEFVCGLTTTNGPNHSLFYRSITSGIMLLTTISYDSKSPHVLLRTALISQQHYDDILWLLGLPYIAHHLTAILHKIIPDT